MDRHESMFYFTLLRDAQFRIQRILSIRWKSVGLQQQACSDWAALNGLWQVLVPPKEGNNFYSRRVLELAQTSCRWAVWHGHLSVRLLCFQLSLFFPVHIISSGHFLPSLLFCRGLISSFQMTIWQSKPSPLKRGQASWLLFWSRGQQPGTRWWISCLSGGLIACCSLRKGMKSFAAAVVGQASDATY